MTWEETIIFIRTQPEFKELVEKAYFEEDLVLNVDRFKKSEEFNETIQWIKLLLPNAERILDVGSGNGISAVGFASLGYKVTAVEPDASNTIGAEAIRKLKDHYNLKNLDVLEGFAESLNLEKNSFDLVYVRQAMHHAYNLNEFVGNLSSLIRPGGYLLTVRDHVVYNAKDKEWFLESHPLQKYYGGENAFTFQEYIIAMKGANLSVINVIKHFDSVINYFPMTRAERNEPNEKREKQLEALLVNKIGGLGRLPFVKSLYKKRINFQPDVFDESKVPGRMYSFIAQKR